MRPGHWLLALIVAAAAALLALGTCDGAPAGSADVAAAGVAPAAPQTGRRVERPAGRARVVGEDDAENAGPEEGHGTDGPEGRTWVAGEGGATGATPESTDGPAPDGGPDAPPGEGGKAPHDARDPIRKVKGVVVDAATGAPIAGARILFGVVSRETGRLVHAHGDESDAQGRFSPAFDDDETLERGSVMEVRIRAPGYELVRRAAEAEPMRIEMQRWTHPPAPGRVAGYLTGEGERPSPGRVLVEAMDEFGNYVSLWARADAGGAFVLEGVPPGPWRFHADGSGAEWVDASVPDGGETRVHLRGAPDRESALIAARKSVHSAEMNLAGLAAGNPELRGEMQLDLVLAEQAQRSWTAVTSPGRDVVVEGLRGDAAAAVLRLQPADGKNWVWRARTAGGTARFEDVPLGRYRISVETADALRPLVGTGVVEVADGEGPLVLRTE